MLFYRKFLKIDLNQSIEWNCFECNKTTMNISIKIRFWHSSMQNLFIINRFDHFESKKSIDSVIYNQYKIFDVFVRIHRNENTISHKMQFEQWIRLNLTLSKIKTYSKISTEKMRIIQSRIDVFWTWRTYNLLNEHATNLTNMRYVWRARNESRACNWTKNHFIISSIFYQKMINNIENIFDWISKLRKYVVQTSKTILSKNISILYFRRDINLSFNQNRSTKTLYQRLIARWRLCIYTNQTNATYSRFRLYVLFDHYRSTKIHNLNRSSHMIARTTIFAITCFYTIETCNMQQISHKTKYKRQTTLKQIVKYIVLLLFR